MWIAGRPASGKSTLAARAHAAIASRGAAACVLDGDAVRDALVPRPGYDEASRGAFYETLARLAALLAGQGLVVLVAATAGRDAYREAARAIAPRFVEVLVDVPPEVCAARDPKGLYARAAAGLAPDVPGVGAPFEAPARPDVVAAGGHDAGALAAVVALATAVVGPGCADDRGGAR